MAQIILIKSFKMLESMNQIDHESKSNEVDDQGSLQKQKIKRIRGRKSVTEFYLAESIAL